MNSPSEVPAPRWRLRRWVLWALLVLPFLISIPIVRELYARHQAWQELNELIASLDATDPDWRLDKLEAARLKVPKEKNSAMRVLAARRLLPNDWEAIDKRANELEKIPANVALRPDQVLALRAELHPLALALQNAREIRDYPVGRHTIRFSPDWISTLLPDQQSAREVASLLNLDVWLLMHDMQTGKSWRSNQALLNAGRSLGDEPFLITMLIRMAVDKMAIRNMERILGQGEIAEPLLAECQRAFLEEINVPLLLFGIRGERAGMNELFSNFENGKLPLLLTLGNAGGRQQSIESNWLDPISEFFAFSMVLRSHATVLRLGTEAIETAKLPAPERYRSFNELDTKFRDELSSDDRGLILARALFPAVTKVAQAERNTKGLFACAVAGLAAERFRLKNNRWPGSLAELLRMGFLSEIPLDLCQGKPLSFRRASDGLVIFSAGPDSEFPERTYKGDALDERPAGVVREFVYLGEPQTRVEFRLWDVRHRRKGPPPKQKQVDDD